VKTDLKILSIVSYKNRKNKKLLKTVYPQFSQKPFVFFAKPIGFLENRFFPDGLISSAAHPRDGHGKYADSKSVEFLVRRR
jgi:hypothetical protein